MVKVSDSRAWERTVRRSGGRERRLFSSYQLISMHTACFDKERAYLERYTISSSQRRTQRRDRRVERRMALLRLDIHDTPWLFLIIGIFAICDSVLLLSFFCLVY